MRAAREPDAANAHAATMQSRLAEYASRSKTLTISPIRDAAGVAISADASEPASTPPTTRPTPTGPAEYSTSRRPMSRVPRAERHAHADLLRTLGHDVGQDAEQAGDREHES